MKREDKSVLAFVLLIGWCIACASIVKGIDKAFPGALILLLLCGVGTLTIWFLIFRTDLLNKMPKSWKKIQKKNLEKRIKRLKSYLDLCGEYMDDSEDGHLPDPYILKQRKKLDELELKLYELTTN